MSKRGRMVYIPPNLLDEAEDIMREKGHNKRSQAFLDLTKYAKVGREAERIYQLDFLKKRRRK